MLVVHDSPGTPSAVFWILLHAKHVVIVYRQRTMPFCHSINPQPHPVYLYMPKPDRDVAQGDRVGSVI